MIKTPQERATGCLTFGFKLIIYFAAAVFLGIGVMIVGMGGSTLEVIIGAVTILSACALAYIAYRLP